MIPYTARDFPDSQFELQTEEKGPLRLVAFSLKEMRERNWYAYRSGQVMMVYCQHLHVAKRFDMRALVGSTIELRTIAARNMSMSDAEIDRLSTYSKTPFVFQRIAKALLKDGSSSPLKCKVIEDLQVAPYTARMQNMKGGSTQVGIVTLQLLYEEGDLVDMVRKLVHVVDPFEIAEESEFTRLFAP